MMEVGVQTEEFDEEELDWDLSDNVDRETQTLPPNPTLFQLNRSDAFVQTDYRYLPLAEVRPPTSRGSIKLVDASTQTEQCTTSVSTQTEEPYLLPYPPAAEASSMCGPNHTSERQVLVHQADASSGPAHSGLGSALQRTPILGLLPGILLPNPEETMPMPLSPPPSPDHKPAEDPSRSPMELLIPPTVRVKTKATERWNRLVHVGMDDIMPVAFTPSFIMRHYRTRRKMVDVSIQTDNDILTDEAPRYAARPPPCRKTTLLESIDFTDIDVHALTAPKSVSSETTSLVKYLCGPARDDLQRLRAIFRWVTENLRYDWKYIDKEQTVEEILQSRAGVGKDFVTLTLELCNLASIRVKKIQGFARSHDFRVGRILEPEKDPLHIWTAVFLYGAWRFLDPTWGAGYVDSKGKYHPQLQEHYFLTDPEQMIYTHFPYHEHELDYNRWQLLDNPLTLEEFNALPKVMPEFWECRLRLTKPKTSPVTFTIQTEILLTSSSLIRYKYKFFPADEDEGASINQWVFCTVKENGAVGSFLVQPPREANFILKIYAGLEELLLDEGSALPHVVTYQLICEKARRNPVAWPLHDVAWGPTPRLYECGLYPVNHTAPVITTWGGKRLIYFEKAFDILIMYQMYDCSGQLLDLKGILRNEETEDQVRLVIIPPGTGYFKFLIYGIPRPQVGGSLVRGRWRLPLLASYLIECKTTLSIKIPEVPTEKKKSKRRMKPNIRR